jgi:hypothetical protein
MSGRKLFTLLHVQVKGKSIGIVTERLVGIPDHDGGVFAVEIDRNFTADRIAARIKIAQYVPPRKGQNCY